ncbi:MAG: methyltransferase domain-containing protein [Gemmatimonadota bacterium]|nr:methyltransferase domain-containing protein [Gemmatimonadota bacterium]
MAYQFDHEWEQERARLGALEAVFDPCSRRCIEEIDPQPGWRCLEVGAGGGSMTEWLCSVVGSEGSVVATDVETKFVSAIEAPNLEVREHDIVSDPLEMGSFDLIHTRAVLDHLPERDAVIARLVDALRPGGWLVVLGGDFSTVRATSLSAPDAEFFDEAFATVVDAGRAVGFDPRYGRRLGAALREAGLREVSVEGSIFEWDARHPLARLYSLTFQRLTPLVLETGRLTAGNLERLLAMMTDPDFHGLSNTLFAARGRKVPD